MTAAPMPDMLRDLGPALNPRKPPPKGRELIHSAAGIHRRVTWAGLPLTVSYRRGRAIWQGSVVDARGHLLTLPAEELFYVGGAA